MYALRSEPRKWLEDRAWGTPRGVATAHVRKLRSLCSQTCQHSMIVPVASQYIQWMPLGAGGAARSYWVLTPHKPKIRDLRQAALWRLALDPPVAWYPSMQTCQSRGSSGSADTAHSIHTSVP